MKRLALAVTAAIAFAAPIASPVGAQSLAILLPVLSFPGPVLTPSTKSCDAVTMTVCDLTK